jgi:hypothetical protein
MSPAPVSPSFRCPVCNSCLKYAHCPPEDAVWTCDGMGEGTPCTDQWCERGDEHEPWYDWADPRWRCVSGCDYDVCSECVPPPERRLTPCTPNTMSVNQKVYYRPQDWEGQDWSVQRVWIVKKRWDYPCSFALLHLGELGRHHYANDDDITVRIDDCYHLTDLTDGTEVGHTDIGEIVAPLSW